ncbi:putative NAD/FAD-dependent oxidoreductase [Bacillus ectoiniformans]|uniref:NAD(P)/FAD-dependent oxidoreductase n=1 Tax=Bacillus ectoiniformans TaxID=1494429 RepID=UPI00195889D7|nr:FAD-dependent oxidoreductase [Bacillus ectoiniformans]MBM7649202.1 putative NAD/FAD-dependent oxidoreductase [Bacillus ectoiniformans]
METLYDAVIIGAGLAGISAAEELIEAKKRVLLIDKGRSVGGRLATRRIGSGKADHGAQFFTVRSERLQEKVDEWLEKGWVKKWFGEDHPRYMAIEGMNHLAKQLSKGMDIKLNTQVTALESIEEGWLIQPIGIKAKAVILTAPAPQSADLLKNSELENLQGFKRLDDIKFHTCLVLLAEMKHSPKWNETGFLKENLAGGVDRMVNHMTKGMSDKPILTVYMTAEWSNQHFNEDDEEIVEQIIKKTESSIDRADIQSVQLKRWKYSEAKHLYRQPFLTIGDDDSLFVSGDAFLFPDDQGGSRVESAFLSGKAAGEKIKQSQKAE